MNTLTLANELSDLVPIVIPIAGLLFVGFCITITALRTLAETKAREQTKREIAAYMAEGSISAEDAERILQDNTRRRSC